jgi:hypothetical protein
LSALSLSLFSAASALRSCEVNAPILLFAITIIFN